MLVISLIFLFEIFTKKEKLPALHLLEMGHSIYFQNWEYIYYFVVAPNICSTIMMVETCRFSLKFHLFSMGFS